MPLLPPAEQMQSARAVSQASQQIVNAIAALRKLVNLRSQGLLEFGQLDSAQLTTLGLLDPSQLDKMLDIVDSQPEIYDKAAAASGLAG